MKIKQIAIQVPNIEKAKMLLEEIFNANFSIGDSMVMEGQFDNDTKIGIPLTLAFDYEMLSDADELELINSPSEYHWHSQRESGFLSHLGVYCENGIEFDVAQDKLKALGFKEIQHSISSNHSRKNSDETERRYIDAIYKTEQVIGFNIKLSLKVN